MMMFPFEEVLIVTPLAIVKTPPALTNISPASLNELLMVMPDAPVDFWVKVKSLEKEIVLDAL
jgi:hypothetical protein